MHCVPEQLSAPVRDPGLDRLCVQYGRKDENPPSVRRQPENPVACGRHQALRGRFVTGVAPGLQNRRQALPSAVGSTPMRPRQWHISVHPKDSGSGRLEQKNLLRLELQEVFFVLAQKQAKVCPAFIILARRTAMKASFSEAYAQTQSATGCTEQSELAHRLGIRQCFISDSRRRNEITPELSAAWLKLCPFTGGSNERGCAA